MVQLAPTEPRPKPLPDKQQQVYDYITSEVDAGKRFPSMHAIARFMGWKSDSSAIDCLDRLVYRGKLRRTAAEPSAYRRTQRYRWELA